MKRIHLVGIGAGFGNSAIYFVHALSFGYGSKLVQDGEMTMGNMFRYL